MFPECEKCNQNAELIWLTDFTLPVNCTCLLGSGGIELYLCTNIFPGICKAGLYEQVWLTGYNLY